MGHWIIMAIGRHAKAFLLPLLQVPWWMWACVCVCAFHLSCTNACSFHHLVYARANRDGLKKWALCEYLPLHVHIQTTHVELQFNYQVWWVVLFVKSIYWDCKRALDWYQDSCLLNKEREMKPKQNFILHATVQLIIETPRKKHSPLFWRWDVCPSCHLYSTWPRVRF